MDSLTITGESIIKGKATTDDGRHRTVQTYGRQRLHWQDTAVKLGYLHSLNVFRLDSSDKSGMLAEYYLLRVSWSPLVTGSSQGESPTRLIHEKRS